MKKAIPLILICLLFISCMSCSTMSYLFPAPETPEENIVYAQTILTATNNSVIVMLKTNLMASAEAKAYRIEKKKADDLLNLYQIYVRQDQMISAHDQWRLLEDILNEFSNKYILKGANNNGFIDSGSIIDIR